jgi:unsaturated rhamnogalacturonyl hydrolase
VLDRALVRAAADLLMAYRFRPWFYGDTVGFEALVAASELLDDPSYEGFCHGFARGAFARDADHREMDNTVPGKVLVELAVRRGDGLLLEALVRLHTALQQRPLLGGAPVSLDPSHLIQPYGGVPLPPDEVALLADPGPGVYVDCLHFDPPFTAALGVALGSEELLGDAERGAGGFLDLLQDPATGLLHHFFLARTARAYALGWSRGQGWGLLGLLDVLAALATAGRTSERLTTAVRDCLRAMGRRQRADGHWGAVVMRPASPPETSAAAFMVVALLRARRLGVIDDELDGVLHRAETALESSAAPSGHLTGVSAVVWSSTQPGHYDHVPVGHTVPWGQGPLVLALAERARQPVPSR